MHWFVVAVFIFCIVVTFLQDGPIWVQIILAILLLGMPIRNSNFSISTCFSNKDKKIRTKHVGIFGAKRREVDFSEVEKLIMKSKGGGATEKRRVLH